MSAKKRILVSGFYGAANVGDELLLTTALCWLRELGAEPTVISLNPAETAKMYGVATIDFHNLGEIVQALITSDMLLLAGGGIFQDHHPFSLAALFDPLVPDIAQYARPILAACQLGIPTFVLAHGVGPLRGEQSRAIVRDIFSNVSYASLRDEGSAKLLSAIGVDRTFHVAADPGWAADVEGSSGTAPIGEATADRPLRLGLIIRDWPNTSDWQQKLTNALNEVLDSRWQCRWISFQTAIDETLAISDRSLLDALACSLDAGIANEMIDCRSVKSACDAISECDAVVSMRLHGSILAILAGKSCGFIEYDAKMAAVNCSAGVPDILRLPLTASKSAFIGLLRSVIDGIAGGWRIAPERQKELLESALTHRALLEQALVKLPNKSNLHWKGRDLDWVAVWLERAIWRNRTLERQRFRSQELFEFRNAQLLRCEETIKDYENSLRLRDAYIAEKEVHVATLQLEAARTVQLTQEIQRQSERIADQEVYIAEKEIEVARLQKQFGGAASEIARSAELLRALDSRVESLSTYFNEKEIHIAQLTQELDRMKSKRGRWRKALRSFAHRAVRLPLGFLRSLKDGDRPEVANSSQAVIPEGSSKTDAPSGPAFSSAFGDVAILREEEIVIFSPVHLDALSRHHPAAWLATTAKASGHRVFFVSADTNEMDDQGIARLYLRGLTPTALFARLSSKAVLISTLISPEIVPFFIAARQRGLRAVLDVTAVPEGTVALDGALLHLAEYSTQVVVGLSQTIYRSQLPAERLLMRGGHTCHRFFDRYKPLARPANLPKRVANVVVYAPGGDDDVDWSYLARTAALNPAHCFFVIGACAPVVSMPKNVILLDNDTLAEANGYIAHADLVLVPAANNANSGQPVFQGLFAAAFLGRPVISSRAPGSLTFAALRICSEPERFESHTDCSSEAGNEDFISQSTTLAHLEAIVPPRGRGNVSVVILIHNNARIVGRCLNTLLAHCRPFIHEIIVVDNASSDGGADIVLSQFPGVTLLRNPVNGCSSGRNLGSRHASGEYIAYFDSDQWFVGGSGFIEALTILERNARVGAVGWNAGWFDAGRDDLGGMISDYCPNRAMNADAIHNGFRVDIGFLGTSGMFLRRSLYDSTDGFDIIYDPTIFEDTDFCFQIRALGFELAFRDLSGVRHQPHQTTGADAGSDRYRDLFLRNSNLFKAKWLSYQHFLVDYTP